MIALKSLITTFIYSFLNLNLKIIFYIREWSQKALEEEQKKREEDRRKKDVEREKKKQQNQHAKQLQEPGNVAIPQANPQQRGVVSQTSTARQKKNFASPVS